MNQSLRPSVDEVLIHNAYTWAARGTCARAQVGAVLAIDGRTIASGYNGAPAGQPHCVHDCDCDLNGSPFKDNVHRSECASVMSCEIAVHAEANVIAFAARYGMRTDSATLYTTMMPCAVCARLLINAGVVRVVAIESYRNEDGMKLLIAARVVVELAAM